MDRDRSKDASEGIAVSTMGHIILKFYFANNN